MSAGVKPDAISSTRGVSSSCRDDIQDIDSIQLDLASSSGKRSSSTFIVKVKGSFEWHSLFGVSSWEAEYNEKVGHRALQKSLLTTVIMPAMRKYYASQHFLRRKAASAANKLEVPLNGISVWIDGEQLDKGERPPAKQSP